MPRFQSKIHAYNQAKRSWICKTCGNIHTQPKPDKCAQCRTGTDFHYFASKKEFKRYQDLLMLRLAGKIKDIETQPKFPLVINGHKYNPSMDFKYVDIETGKEVIEDVKTEGTNTRISRLLRDLVEEGYRIKVILV